MVYDTAFLDNSTNLYEFATGVNTQTNFLIGNVLLLVIFIVMLVSLKKFETKAVLLVSSFTVLILSILEVFMLWVSQDTVFLCLSLTLIMLMVNIFGRD